MLRRLLLFRPSFWTCLIACCAYWDDTALHGKFVYDDNGSVKLNVVVNGNVPWKEVATRDYWGTPMSTPKSHKSFRPITTMSFKLNWVLAEYLRDRSRGSNDDNNNNNNNSDPNELTYSFHVINVLLHGAVTGLVTEVSQRYLFAHQQATAVQSALIVGLLFGLHPVHAEAVSNITSRGELLMSLFFCLAFLSYAGNLPNNNNKKKKKKKKKKTLSIAEQEPTATPAISSSNQKLPVTSRLLSIMAEQHKRKREQPNEIKQQQQSQEAVASAPRRKDCVSLPSIVGIYIVPWLCMTLSMFSKEQGATTLISLVIYDFLLSSGCGSVRRYLSLLIFRRHRNNRQDPSRRGAAVAFSRRALVLACQTVAVCAWRKHLNGESSPDFIFDQNPAGFSEDRATRLLSIGWVWVLYVRDALLPFRLAPDWSGKSIDLLTTTNVFADPRVFVVLLLWTAIATGVLSLLWGTGGDNGSNQEEEMGEGYKWRAQDGTRCRCRAIFLTAVFAFTASPFLLSSNLLVVVGLMKADRVIYLPLAGFCILEALWVNTFFLDEKKTESNCNNKTNTANQSSDKTASGMMPNRTRALVYLFVMLQLSWFSALLHQRNVAWSDPLHLWARAYQVNPRSDHTIYNYGYELSLAQRYEEAEQVLRPIADPHTDGPRNTFVYAMVLYNLQKCHPRAHNYLNMAFSVIEEKKANYSVRNNEDSVARTESNLLVAKAFCTADIFEGAQIVYQAVETDRTNEYAIQTAMQFVKRVEAAQKMQATGLRQKRR